MLRQFPLLIEKVFLLADVHIFSPFIASPVVIERTDFNDGGSGRQRERPSNTERARERSARSFAQEFHDMNLPYEDDQSSVTVDIENYYAPLASIDVQH